MTGYVWVDYMCVPQEGIFEVRLPYLKSVPYVIAVAEQVWTPTKNNDYRRSIRCNMEQFMESDDGLALVEEYRILKSEDLEPIILGLKEILLLLLIHSEEYRRFVGRTVSESPFCNPAAFGSPYFVVFDRPNLHMINPTLARICEYYLRLKYAS